MSAGTAQDNLFTTNLIACTDCGCINDDATALVQELQDTIEALKDDIAAKLRTIKVLKAQGDEYRRNSPEYQAAMRVLEHWRELCHPDARELEGERLKKVIARLKGRPKPYTEELLIMAVNGYSRFPYVIDGKRCAKGTPGQRFIDAELIFRDPKHVDQGLALAKEARWRETWTPPGTFETVPWRRVQAANRSRILAELRLRFGAGLDHEYGYKLFPCPHCDNDPACTVEVAPPGKDWVMLCSICGLNEDRFLKELM